MITVLNMQKNADAVFKGCLDWFVKYQPKENKNTRKIAQSCVQNLIIELYQRSSCFKLLCGLQWQSMFVFASVHDVLIRKTYRDVSVPEKCEYFKLCFSSALHVCVKFLQEVFWSRLLTRNKYYTPTSLQSRQKKWLKELDGFKYTLTTHVANLQSNKLHYHC